MRLNNLDAQEGYGVFRFFFINEVDDDFNFI